jgi:hypothetical protein
MIWFSRVLGAHFGKGKGGWKLCFKKLCLGLVFLWVLSAGHTMYWNNKPDHQHSKLFLREPLGAVSRKILKMSKKRLRLLVGTVSRHYSAIITCSISDSPRAVLVTDVKLMQKLCITWFDCVQRLQNVVFASLMS